MTGDAGRAEDVTRVLGRTAEAFGGVDILVASLGGPSPGPFESATPSLRAHMATRTPSAASPSAQALPMPLLDATTSARLPFSPRSIGFPCRSGCQESVAG